MAHLHAIQAAAPPSAEEPPAPTKAGGSPPGPRRVSPERLRERAALAESLAFAISQCGSSHSAIAERLKLSRSIVDDWCDPAHPSTIGADYIRLLPPAVEQAMAAARAAEMRAKTSNFAGLSPMQVALQVSRECGEFASAVLDAELDGHTDSDEARRALKELAELEERIGAARAVLSARVRGAGGAT